jgi:predicted transglutaminase-like cysteine proteinase
MKKQSTNLVLRVVMIAIIVVLGCLKITLALDMNQIQMSYRKMGGSPEMLTEWQMMLREANELPVNGKLKRVNEFFNRHIAFVENRDVWGRDDYWATPLETMIKAKGDCKGYVIAKYFALLELNVPIKQLRLIYVKAQIGGPESSLQQAHMILAYYSTPEAEPLILDNLITDIRPASRRTDLLPIFSFNSEGLFVGVAGGATVGPGGVGQLSSWADLLRRVHAEGF